MMKRGNACGAKDLHHKYCYIFNGGYRLSMTTTEEQIYFNYLELDRTKDKFKVNRLRMKLGNKAKREPKFRFYTLYGHICRKDVLHMAWLRVKSNRGGAGIDGVRIDSFDSYEKVDALLSEIQEELQNETYRPSPVKRVFIPKPNGKQRPLGIPTVKDRVVQMATVLILEPIFEEDFLGCSFGFRPGKSAEGALNTIRDNLKSGRTEVYDADLKGYFDTIPHDKLMSCLEMRIADRKVLKLIRLWLKCPTSEYDDDDKRWKQRPPSKQGTPQGGVISPLLANLYLHWFDTVFHRLSGPYKWANARIVRYADDFVIMARYIGRDIKEWVIQTIEKWLGLTINLDKSTVVNLQKGEVLNFLGYSFKWDDSFSIPGSKYLNMCPSKKAISKEIEAIREMTSSRYNCLPIREVIRRVNRQITGWLGYFNKGYYRVAARKINHYLTCRFTNHLKRRSQRRYRPPEGTSYYSELKKLGLIYL